MGQDCWILILKETRDSHKDGPADNCFNGFQPCCQLIHSFLQIISDALRCFCPHRMCGKNDSNLFAPLLSYQTCKEVAIGGFVYFSRVLIRNLHDNVESFSSFQLQCCKPPRCRAKTRGLSALAGAIWRWLHMRGAAEKLIPAASQLVVSPVQGSTNIDGLEQWKRL